MDTRNTIFKPVVTRLAGLVLGALFSLNASASTVLEATDGDITTMGLPLTAGQQYGIFAPTNTSFNTGLGYLSLALWTNRVVFTDTGSGWDLTETVSNSTLHLSDNRFVIAFNSGSSWHADTGWITASSSPTSNLYTLGFETVPNTLTVFDVTPVPVPPAVWLFGSGLIGMVVVARRGSSAKA